MSLFTLGAPNWFWQAINSLWLMICRIIYVFIGYLYRVFDQVARVNLFSTEVFEKITGRIYIIMGIAMLFIFAYNLVLMIINPDDKKGTGATTKIIKETIISLVAVVLLPTIFNYMYTFQNHILSTNIIGQVILGGVGNTSGDVSECDPDDYECSCNFSNFEELNDYSGTYTIPFTWISWNYNANGKETDNLKAACDYYKSDKLSDSTRGAYSIAPTIFSAFYRPANFSFGDCVNYLSKGDTSVISTDQDKQICVNFFYDVTMSKYSGSIASFVNDTYLNGIISDSTDDSMEFDWLFAIIAGGLAVWMFLCYAMEIGVRVAKLGILQIISPIAVMMRVVPGQKEKMYKKWFDNLLNTYLDVFIRLVIIYFSLFAISLVPDVIETMWSSLWSDTNSVGDFFIKTLAMVVVILGILKFAQEAPALIKEFFGSSGRFSIKPSEQKQLKGGIGAIGTIGNRAINKAGNFGRIIKSKDLTNKEKAIQFAKNTGSMLNPLGYGKAGYQGYKATQDGKVLDGINAATAKNLTEKGMLYKAKAFGGDAIDQMKHYYAADYTGLNADALKRENGMIDAFMKPGKTAFDRVESNGRFKDLNNYYEERKKKEKEAGNMSAVETLESQRKAAVKELRRAVAEEKMTGREVIMSQSGDDIHYTNGSKVDLSKTDMEFKNAVSELQRGLKENFSSIEKILKEGNASFKDMNNNVLPNSLEAISKEIDIGNTTLVDDLNKKLGEKLGANNVELSRIKELAEGKKDKK